VTFKEIILIYVLAARKSVRNGERGPRTRSCSEPLIQMIDPNSLVPMLYFSLSTVRGTLIFPTFRELALTESWCRYMTMGNVQHNSGIMNQPLSQNFREYPQVPCANSLNTKLSVDRTPVSRRKSLTIPATPCLW
jgi:hypothetical protein